MKGGCACDGALARNTHCEMSMIADGWASSRWESWGHYSWLRIVPSAIAAGKRQTVCSTLWAPGNPNHELSRLPMSSTRPWKKVVVAVDVIVQGKGSVPSYLIEGSTDHLRQPAPVIPVLLPEERSSCITPYQSRHTTIK